MKDDIQSKLIEAGIIIPTHCQCGKPGTWQYIKKKLAFWYEPTKEWLHTECISVICDICAKRFINSGYSSDVKTSRWH